MNSIIYLLKPRLWSFKNRLQRLDGRQSLLRVLGLGGLGIFFWFGTFVIFYRVLSYFQSVEGFGDILAQKLLSMVLLILFSILIFSSVLTALSTLYLANDLMLVHSVPVCGEQIFLARWIESTMDSSWMVILFSLPVFLAYGLIYSANLGFFLTVLGSMLPLCMVASALGTIAVMLLVVSLPADRTRDIFLFLCIIVVLVLYFTFRLIRPERLVDPDAFATIILYFESMKTPGSPFLPSAWCLETLWPFLGGKRGDRIFYFFLLWTTAISLIFIQTRLAGIIYFKGVSRSQVARRKISQKVIDLKTGLYPFLPVGRHVKIVLFKDIKSFFRDNTQWSQMFLLGAVIVVYLYNFKVLPLERSPIKAVYLQNVLSFLNMGLAGFVLAAVSVRFVFPAVSMEGRAYWIIKSSPVKTQTFLWAKFWTYIVPLLTLAEVLIISTNKLLKVTPFMMYLSTATIFLMVFGITAMGVGMGAMYPNFYIENMAQAATGFGGMLYMILCMGYIGLVVVLEAGPVYTIFMSQIGRETVSILEWIWIISSFGLVLVLNIMAVLLPMRLGVRRLSDFEEA
nr:hypothetical protein [Desulfobacterales bacterium]